MRLTVVARVGGVVAAATALWLGIEAAGDLYLTGFPDGHLTDYDIAAVTPKRILMWVEFGFIPFFLVLAFARTGNRLRAFGLVAAAVALALVAIVQIVGIPWYFIDHLGLDNGIGG
jgi:hypothetical protein